MEPKEKSCKYNGEVNLGDTEWKWCFYYNAKKEDVNCETCTQTVDPKNIAIV